MCHCADENTPLLYARMPLLKNIYLNSPTTSIKKKQKNNNVSWIAPACQSRSSSTAHARTAFSVSTAGRSSFFFFPFFFEWETFLFPSRFHVASRIRNCRTKIRVKTFFLMRTFSVAFKIGSRHQTEKAKHQNSWKRETKKTNDDRFPPPWPRRVGEKNDCKVRRVVFHRFWCNTWSPPTWQMMEETQLMNKEKKNVLNPMINQTP